MYQLASPDLKFTVGNGVHAAMDVIWEKLCGNQKPDLEEVRLAAEQAYLELWVAKGYPHPLDLDVEDLEVLGARSPDAILETLHCYIDKRWKILKDLDLLAVEQPFLVPLDPRDDSLFYIGRRDKDFVYMGREIMSADHKTTTMYSTQGKRGGPPTFRSGWLDSWHGNSQMDGYLYSLLQDYPDKKIRGIWIDGILLHKEAHDCFTLVDVNRATELLNQWLWMTHYWIELWQANQKALEDLRGSDKHYTYMTAYPCDGTSCSAYGGCPYRDLCRSTANPENLEDPPPGYLSYKWEPFNAEEIQKAYDNFQHRG